jgi:UDP-N-acetylmuramoyl-tripeptide--D-alanyl-D-alanine ligase
MRPRPVASVAAVTRGAVRGGDPGSPVDGVVIDSRAARPGSLFVALPGDRSDGHAFVGAAFDRGATAAMVHRGWDGPGLVVEVEDPATALLDLAGDERSSMAGHVIGITGSTGKTSTKDLTAAVLGSRMSVAANPASFNNEVGLPLTLLSAEVGVDAVVCEMGSRGPGHIRLLCEVARPDMGIVTNVGVAHMEMFGSPEVLRDAKAELPESLPRDGIAVLNATDPVVRAFAERTPARTVVLFGGDGPVRADDVVLDADGLAAFELVAPDGRAPVRLAVPGEHMVANALAAAAAGWALGIGVRDAAEALSRAEVSSGRMERLEAGGVRILNDAYNANPTSVAAALRAARWMAGRGRCVAVLGEMAELGHIAETEHERVGELAARLGIDVLIVVGEDARRIAIGAVREGVEPDRVHQAAGAEDALAIVAGLVEPGDLVLVKGSRVTRLERVAEGLAEALAERTGSGHGRPSG